MKQKRNFFCLFIIIITLLALSSFTLATPDKQTTDKGCPHAKKCPYIAKIQAGETPDPVDWSTTKCPMANGKCPYFEELKKRAEANDGKLELAGVDGVTAGSGCPYIEKCPHFQSSKDGKEGKFSEDYLKEYQKAHGGDVSKCPYLNKSDKEDSDEIKCPHLQKLKKERDAKEENVKSEEKKEEL
ncbi:hypothetical protein G9A89_002587 [Geosiphon pyriformis]|nr:hypothetical protein G9A89_003837 [Geosiphon pyriformis]KAG9298150.1 hypothetical protein G9A89_002587 [Geosiphon pyriformis]